MGVERFRGIVLKEYPVGESGKRIVILTREAGKVMLNVTGARNSKSKFLASAQLFCYSDFCVYEGKGFYSVTQADMVESFYGLRNDIVKLAFGTYLLELTEKTQLAGTDGDNSLKLLLRALAVIEKTDFNVLLATSIFEIKYLQLNGFLDYEDACCSCGKTVEEDAYFSPAGGGIICKDCRKKFYDSKKLLGGTFKAIKYVLKNSDGKIFAFNVSKEVNDELRQVLEEYINTNIGQKFNTLEFAKSCLME